MRNRFLALLISFATILSPAGLSSQATSPFGPFRKGPSRRIGEMKFAPEGSGLNYSLYGDHCEIRGDRFLCLFVFQAHLGAPREWTSEKAWMKNYAIDQFGEKHYKIAAYFLSTRGVQQPTATVGAGDKVYFVQVFENADRTMTNLSIFAPEGEIKGMPVE